MKTTPGILRQNLGLTSDTLLGDSVSASVGESAQFCPINSEFLTHV